MEDRSQALKCTREAACFKWIFYFFILMVCLLAGIEKLRSKSNGGSKREQQSPKDTPLVNISAQTFTFRELAIATKNFKPECFIGEGGFGRVYKGRLESTGQVMCLYFKASYRYCYRNRGLKFQFCIRFRCLCFYPLVN